MCVHCWPRASRVFPISATLAQLTGDRSIPWTCSVRASLARTSVSPAVGPALRIAQGARSGLWLTIVEGIRVLRPKLVVVENVAAIRGRGLGRVLGDLAALGYDTNWVSLRASDVGAAHRRERVFILAFRSE